MYTYIYIYVDLCIYDTISLASVMFIYIGWQQIYDRWQYNEGSSLRVVAKHRLYVRVQYICMYRMAINPMQNGV